MRSIKSVRLWLTAVDYCHRRAWWLLNVMLGVAIASSVLLAIWGDDSTIASKLLHASVPGVLLPLLTNLVTAWQFGKIQSHFGRFADHTNHDLRRAVVLVISRILRDAADNETGLERNERETLRSIAAASEDHWFALLDDPALKPILGRLILEEAIPHTIFGKSSKDESQVWTSLVNAALKRLVHDDGMGGFLHPPVEACVAARLEKDFRGLLREFLKHDFATDGKGWAAFQLVLAEQMYKRGEQVSFAPSEKTSFLEAVRGGFREELDKFAAASIRSGWSENDRRILSSAKHLLGTIDSRVEELQVTLHRAIHKVQEGQSKQGQVLNEIRNLLFSQRDLEPRTAALAERLGIASGAIRTVLATLGAENTPEEKWPEMLADFSSRYRDLEQRLAELAPFHPEAATLRTQARAAVQDGRIDEADALLRRMETLEAECLARAEQNLNQQKLSAAETKATRAEVALLRWQYRDAAALYLQAALLLTGADQDRASSYRDASMEALYRQGHEKGDNAALSELISACRERLEEYTRERQPLKWAVTQNNLGSALAALGSRESGPELLEEAVSAYREAMEEYTRGRFPLQWAGTQNNLGNVLQTLGERESGTKWLEEAVSAYRGALQEYTRERVPLDWAMTQSNLGTVLQTIGERESGTERLEEALSVHRVVLQAYTRERVPLDWAMTQSNIGNALLTLGKRESGTKRLEEAVSAYSEALKEFTRERAPLAWAMAQNNLGSALSALGERESGPKRLEEAVSAYRQALEEHTRGRVPIQWAATQNNIGNALLTLGERESGTKRLEQAVSACRDALEEFTRERVPLQWASTQSNLGNALLALGERLNSPKRLKEAVSSHRESLKERTREKVPLDWARTQSNLGNALLALGERESGTKRLEEAVSAYREAMKEFTRERAPLDWAMTQNNLGNALSALGDRESGTERLEEAVSAYREANKEYTPESVPLQWAMMRNNLGNALLALGEHESGTERLDEAASAYREALEIFQHPELKYYSQPTQQRLEAVEALIADRRAAGS